MCSSDLLSDEVTLDKMIMYKEDFYQKNRITNILNTEISEIRPESKEVVDKTGKSYSYDRLLIASGGYSFVPPIQGFDKAGVFTLREVPDADAIKTYARSSSSVAVIGGGLLGLETAFSMAKLGKKVTVIEFFEWLLPRQLDRDGGKKLQSMLEEKGMNFILGDSVLSVEGNGKAESIVLKSGKVLKADQVIVSAGIRCNLDIAKKAGIAVNNGIVVDDHLMTSIPGIYAAGDVAEHRGKLYGIWPAAKEQGAAAGHNMSGNAIEYAGTMMATVLKITGIDLYSAGDINADGREVISGGDESCYRKLFIAGNTASGAIVLGDREAVKLAQKIIAGKAGVDEFRTYTN